MNAVKKILIILIMFSVLSVPVEARKDVDNSIKIVMDNRSSARKIKELEGQTDYSDLVVKVSEVVNGKTTQFYNGPLGNYDNGIWNKIDFSKISTLELFFPKESRTILICAVGENGTSTIDENEGDLPISEDLSITSQIKINNVNVGENGLRIVDDANLVCDFDISNSSNSSRSIDILFATYTEDGRLCNINKYSQTLASGMDENVQITYQFNAETEYRAKILIWDSLSNMIPIRAEIDFSQESGINAYYYNADNRLIQIDKANGKSLIFTYDNMGNLLQKSIREWGNIYD